MSLQSRPACLRTTRDVSASALDESRQETTQPELRARVRGGALVVDASGLHAKVRRGDGRCEGRQLRTQSFGCGATHEGLEDAQAEAAPRDDGHVRACVRVSAVQLHQQLWHVYRRRACLAEEADAAAYACLHKLVVVLHLQYASAQRAWG